MMNSLGFWMNYKVLQYSSILFVHMVCLRARNRGYYTNLSARDFHIISEFECLHF